MSPKPNPTDLTPLTIEFLKSIREHRLRGRAREKPDCYLAELATQTTVTQTLEIERRAMRLFAVYDEAALQAEFDKRLSPDGLFNIGFDCPIDDVDTEMEPWAAAWQLAIEDVLANPPEYPAATLEQITEWLRWQPPVTERKPAQTAPAQIQLF